LTAAIGGEHSRGNGNRSANNLCEECKLKSRRVTFKDNLAHRRLKLERLSKVAASEIPQVVSVLRVERQIQTKCMAQLSQLSMRRALTQHLLDGISGEDVNHKKGERENEKPESRPGEEESFEGGSAPFLFE